VLSGLQTRDGYVWVGTKGGLARFDGVRFTVFGEHTNRQLHDNEVSALAEGDDGNLWLGTYGGGLTVHPAGRFQTYTTKEGLINNYVSSLSADHEGGLWIGTDGGLSRFVNGRFKNYTVAEGLPHASVRALYADAGGTLWIGTGKGGLARLRNDRISP